MEILGPAWQVDLFVGDAPCLAGLGQAGLADVMRDVVTKVGIRAPYLHYMMGMLAPGAATRTTDEDDELAAWTDPRDRDMEA